jgi:hypothetical protein
MSKLAVSLQNLTNVRTFIDESASNVNWARLIVVLRALNPTSSTRIEVCGLNPT